jgi:hypothetical protein
MDLELKCPAPVTNLLDDATEAATAAHALRVIAYNTAKVSYDKALRSWSKIQKRACGVIKGKSGYSGYQTVRDLDRAYKMMDALKALRPKGDGRTTQITEKILSLSLANCKNIMEYYVQFLDLNMELIKTDPMGILPNLWLYSLFLKGLDSIYTIFTTSFF